MEMREDYIINTEASMVAPHFGNSGDLHSLVMESDQLFFVRVRPEKLIDDNLRRNGTSLRGAADGAKQMIGSSTMAPVVFNKKHKMYWTPTMSPQSPYCVWLAVSHILKYEEKGKHATMVHMRNGSKIEVACSLYRFKQRMQRAYSLQSIIENQSKHLLKPAKICTQRFYIRKNHKGVNYDLDE